MISQNELFITTLKQRINTTSDINIINEINEIISIYKNAFEPKVYPLGIQLGKINIIRFNHFYVSSIKKKEDIYTFITNTISLEFLPKIYYKKQFTSDLNQITQIGNGIVILTQSDQQFTLANIREDLKEYINQNITSLGYYLDGFDHYFTFKQKLINGDEFHDLFKDMRREIKINEIFS